MEGPSPGGDDTFKPTVSKDSLTERVRRGLIPSLFSAVVPGIGQIMKGESWRGMTLVVLSVLLFVFSIFSYGALSVSSSHTSFGHGAVMTMVAFLPYITIWSYAVLDALLTKRIR